MVFKAKIQILPRFCIGFQFDNAVYSQLIFQRCSEAVFVLSVLINQFLSEKNHFLSELGFRADGSICYFNREAIAAEWQNSDVDIILSVNDRFPRNHVVSHRAIATLALLAEKASQTGTQILIIAAPIPPTVADFLERDTRFTWITEWRAEMQAQFGSLFVDAHDPKLITTPDAEFMDAIHPGETAMLRTLNKSMEQRPDLVDFFDQQNIQEGIRTGAGKVITPSLITVSYPIDPIIKNQP